MTEVGQADVIYQLIGDSDAHRLSAHDAVSAAATFKNIRRLYPSRPILIAVGGYDDDDRELWDIPEARAYIKEWARAANLDTPESAALMAIPVTTRELTDPKWAGEMIHWRIEFVGLLSACGCWDHWLTVPGFNGKSR